MRLGVRAVDDIIGQGRDREPRRRPGRLALIAALVAVAAGVAGYLSLARHHPAAPSAAPSASAAASVPAEPDGIAGPALAWASSLRLPAAGARPSWFSPASGRSEPIGGLPADNAGYQFTRVAGGWAVQARPTATVRCAGCAGPSGPAWFLADGAQSVTSLGPATLVAPAATAGAAWLTSYPAGASLTTAAGTAVEASAAGQRTRPVRLPPGYVIVRGTGYGLLLAPVSQPPAGTADRLWDPATARSGQAFDQVLAASPGEIAWAAPCDPRCRVQALDLATGRRTAVTLPAGSSAVSGAFSPDGDFLAVAVSAGSGSDNGDLAVRLEVAPVASGRLAVVPGTFASSDALVGFGWPGGGDSLVAEFRFTTKTQLASWHPGAALPAVAVVPVSSVLETLVLGQDGDLPISISSR